MMLRMLIIGAIALIIIAVLAWLLFRHEIQTWAHQINRKDELKELEYKLKRLEMDSQFYSGAMGHELEQAEVNREIQETKNIIKEIKGEK